jgi:hypothetical protein
MNCALRVDHLLVEIERERKIREAVAAIRRISFWDNTEEGEFLREIYGASRAGGNQHMFDALAYGTAAMKLKKGK